MAANPRPDCGGKSILELLWEELMAVYQKLVTEYGTEGPGAQDSEEVWQAYYETRGQAQGLALAIAVLLNPYIPDTTAVKNEAALRWAAASQP